MQTKYNLNTDERQFDIIDPLGALILEDQGRFAGWIHRIIPEFDYAFLDWMRGFLHMDDEELLTETRVQFFQSLVRDFPMLTNETNMRSWYDVLLEIIHVLAYPTPPASVNAYKTIIHNNGPSGVTYYVTGAPDPCDYVPMEN